MSDADREPRDDGGLKFWAFLSYSHHDRKWADWLHRSLERRTLPRRLVGRRSGTTPIPRRLFPVFRDRDELPTSSDLGRALRDALGASRALIVICSPTAARSLWVDEEVREFRRLGRGERILCFVVDGDIAAADPARECLCPALRRADGDTQAVAIVPLAADARRSADGRENAYLKLVAGLLGIDYGELRDRERARRRNRRLAWLAASAVACVLGALLWRVLSPDGSPTSGPSGVLVMPFDATEGHATFLNVSVIGRGGGDSLATHWTYWNEQGALLADVFVCMGSDTTILVDPQDVAPRIGPNTVGPSVDLSGKRGLVIVTAFAARAEPSSDECAADMPPRAVDGVLRGEWQVRNLDDRSVLDKPAIHLAHHRLPRTAAMTRGLVFQTANPEELDHGDLILVGLEQAAGAGDLAVHELGPLRRRPGHANEDQICCDASYVDNLGTQTKLPEVCVAGVQFRSYLPSDEGLIPSSIEILSSGTIRLSGCTTTIDGRASEVDGTRALFGFAGGSF